LELIKFRLLYMRKTNIKCLKCKLNNKVKNRVVLEIVKIQPALFAKIKQKDVWVWLLIYNFLKKTIVFTSDYLLF